MIFQDPMTSLNPVYRVGWQIAEQIREHDGVSAARGARPRDRAAALGRDPDAEQRVDDFPHQFSGGMRQRVMIAMALSCSPRVLIADEPTTALDVTIQAQILDLIRTLRRETGSSVVLITHDLGVVAEMADRVLVMYGGRVVEQGTTRAIFDDPQHPYTWGLLGSIPRLDRPRPRRLKAIAGAPRRPRRRRPGCVFAARCPHRFERCAEPPPLEAKRGDGHLDACHLPLEARAGAARAGRRRERAELLLRATDVHQHFPVRGAGRPAARGRPACAPSTASSSRCARARRSGSSASRAAASRRSGARCCA